MMNQLTKQQMCNIINTHYGYNMQPNTWSRKELDNYLETIPGYTKLCLNN